MARLIRDWRALDSEQRLALAAAIALFFTMLLPWYQQTGVGEGTSPKQHIHPVTGNLNAFQVFSFVEAAVLLVAVAVAYLLFARAEGRDFQVPGSDGAVVFGAGAWTGLLLVYRLFDKPGISGVAVGVQWGIFFALVAAGFVAYAGSRMRAAAHLAGGRPGAGPRVARHGRHPDADLGDPDRAPVPARPRPEAVPRDEQLTTVQPERQGETVAGRSRPRYPPPPPGSAEQMSFDDTPPDDA